MNLDLPWAVSGPGPDSVTITGLPIGAQVWITSDVTPENLVTDIVTVGADGVTFNLVGGAVYYLWAQKPGYASIIARAFVAQADP
jgi:hypothetical protein